MPPKTRATATKARQPPKPPKKSSPKKRAPSKKQPAREATPRPKKQPQNDEVWGFIQQQAIINKTLLEEIRGLKDKSSLPCGGADKGTHGQAVRAGGSYDKIVSEKLLDTHIVSSSDLSDSDSDIETRTARDIAQAADLLQPRFNKNQGKNKSLKKAEKQIQMSRPFNFLDRDTQRSIVRDTIHPEELPFLYHLEGTLALAANRCLDVETKGIIQHSHQMVRDAQVYNWVVVRKWSNEVITNTALGEWAWTDADRLQQARNSQYLIPQMIVEGDNYYPCYAYNKGNCRYDNTHFGPDIVLLHTCSFCHAIDGAKEMHPSRSCAKRRSSANYFRNKDESKETPADFRNRFNSQNGARYRKKGKDKDQDEKQSKN